MKSYVKIIIGKLLLAAVAAVAAAVPAGCTREGDSTLGQEFLPENQRMEMRHKSFSAGTITSYDRASQRYVTDDNGGRGYKFIETTFFRTDSIVSSNLSTAYFGVQNDPDGIFGKRNAAFASEFLAMSSLEEEVGFGYKPIFDSIQLLLSVSDYGGDTTRVITYEVYEILSSLEESMSDSGEESGDDDEAAKVAYIDHDMTPLYNAGKRLFTFRFPDQERGVYVSSGAVTMIPDDISAGGVSWDFIRRLLLIRDDDPSWDGYALDTEELYDDDEKWVEAFKGLYIKPVDDLSDGEEGGMYATSLSSTGFTIYGRSRNPEEPRLVKDTMQVNYLFYDQYASVGNNSINTVGHDFAGSALASVSMTDRSGLTQEQNRQSHTPAVKGYIDGMGGPVLEIYLTDEFLNELRGISSDEEFSYAAINQARLHFYLEESDYDWTRIMPELMTPLLDSSMTRLGIYTDYGKLTPIPDYSYVYEAQYDATLAYGGNLGRSTASYTMDVSIYAQTLKNYVDKLNPAGEKNFVYEFDPDDEDYISRTLYLAPEAYGLYSFKRSTVQGMEDPANNASIRIELTYTMIK